MRNIVLASAVFLAACPAPAPEASVAEPEVASEVLPTVDASAPVSAVEGAPATAMPTGEVVVTSDAAPPAPQDQH